VLAAHPQIEMLGYVDDVRPWLSRCSLFVCPILSGSGVRVKLLEAFASGIPVLSTRIGAEGLADEDGRFCALADSPGDFAHKAIGLLNAAPAIEMTSRARAEVEANWDSAVVTARLAESYRALVAAKLNSGSPPSDTSRS